MDVFSAILNLGPAEVLVGFRFPLLAGVIALLVSLGVTPLVRNFALKKGVVDDPNRDDRRSHKVPIPKLGGLAIYAGILVSLLIVLPRANPESRWMPPYLLGILVIGAGLVAVGALDDLKDFAAKIQAVLLLAAGFLVQLFGSHLGRVQVQSLGIPLTQGQYITLPPILAALFTAGYIFIVTKTMDTIDGLDGLAAGIATISAATLCVIATYGHQPRVAIVAAAIAGSSIGFLKHNYNPAKIFMGTGGAYVLGFMLSSLSIVGALKTAAAVSLLIPITVFGVQIFDAFFVITRRIASRQPITQADKRHVHHTLKAKGLSDRRAVLVLYGVAALLCSIILFAVVRHQ